MILENPASNPHYLTTYFPIKPVLHDGNRNANGDYYKKPTNFWYVNCTPEDNFITEPVTWTEPVTINGVNGGEDQQRARSMISPEYARRFILQHILDDQEER